MNDFQLDNKDIKRLPVPNLEYNHIKDSASIYSPMMSLGMKKLKFHHEKDLMKNRKPTKILKLAPYGCFVQTTQ